MTKKIIKYFCSKIFILTGDTQFWSKSLNKPYYNWLINDMKTYTLNTLKNIGLNQK